jgi:hypothetical protein
VNIAKLPEKRKTVLPITSWLAIPGYNRKHRVRAG